MIEVTGQQLTTLDGTPLNGFILFSTDKAVDIPDMPAIFLGSADATVRNGVMDTITLPTTDSTLPPFTYTITMRISGPDGDSDNQVLQNVQIPSTLGPTVDIAQLL